MCMTNLSINTAVVKMSQKGNKKETTFTNNEKIKLTSVSKKMNQLQKNVEKLHLAYRYQMAPF